MTARPDEPTQSDRTGADQWASPAETCRRDPSTAAERQLGMLVECLLRRVEERCAESQSHGAADNCEIEIQQVAHRRHCLPDEPPGALHDLVGRFEVRPPGDGLDRRTGRLGLETTTRPA